MSSYFVIDRETNRIVSDSMHLESAYSNWVRLEYGGNLLNFDPLVRTGERFSRYAIYYGKRNRGQWSLNPQRSKRLLAYVPLNFYGA